MAAPQKAALHSSLDGVTVARRSTIQRCFGIGATNDICLKHLIITSSDFDKIRVFVLATSLSSDAQAAPIEGSDGSTAARGTIDYIAPEVLRGDPPQPAADLFALGVVLYDLLA